MQTDGDDSIVSSHTEAEKHTQHNAFFKTQWQIKEKLQTDINDTKYRKGFPGQKHGYVLHTLKAVGQCSNIDCKDLAPQILNGDIMALYRQCKLV